MRPDRDKQARSRADARGQAVTRREQRNESRKKGSSGMPPEQAEAARREVAEKQRVFTELAEPLLPPPVPGKPREASNLSWLMKAARTLGQDPPVTRRKRRKRPAPAPTAAVAPATATDAEPPADDGEPKPEPFF